jgi:single-strand DNA-binding protein
MSSINKVILIGRVGKEPEIRKVGDSSVANFSLATSEKYKDKSGNTQESTEWHNIVIWGKLAEVVEKYVSKGSQLYLEGKITTRKWQDKDGNDRYTTEINVRELTMLGGLSENQSSGGTGSSPKPKVSDDLPVNDDLPF